MRKPNDKNSEDKAARRLEQFMEAREPTDETCEDRSVKPKKEKKTSPKPLDSDEKPKRKKR